MLLILLLAWAAPAAAATVTVVWDPNPETNIAGYQLSYGPESGGYTTTIDVVGNVTSWPLTLSDGLYYFAIRAKNTDGQIGPYSAEVAYTVASGTDSVISLLTPTSGAVGGSVTITGANFGSTQETSTVTFNGVTATPTAWSDQSISVPVPGGATTGDVLVTVNAVASNGVTFTVVPMPSITSLSPSSGAVTAAVTITGTNFGSAQGTSTVTFNGVTATAAAWTDTSITVLVPSGATSGNVVVTVSGVASTGVPFTVVPTASITALLPASGAVTASIVINGSNFGNTKGTSTVVFNGVTAATTAWSNVNIIAAVPNGATTGNVTVIRGGIASNSKFFEVVPTASITALSPSSGAVNAPVTITGTDFGSEQGTSTVKFNGVTATPTDWSDTSITVPVPGSAAIGNVTVTVIRGLVASNGRPFTVLRIAAASVTAANKVYDGTATATITGCTLSGVVSGDTVTCSAASASFATATVGTEKSVNASGITLGGPHAGNYTLAATTATTTADITAVALTASVTAANKAYDGTATATITGCTLSGVVLGDTVTCSVASASFATATVGTGKSVSATGITLGGSHAANYTLAATTAATTADITPLPLTPSVTAANKVYDGTATAAITECTLSGVVSGDTVTCSAASASFDTATVGAGKPVSAGGITLGGSHAANYTLAATTAATTADITTLALTPSVTVANKVFDGTPTATITGCTVSGVVSGDTVTCSAASASFATAAVGIGKPVSATGITLGGPDAANYTLAATTATTTADITELPTPPGQPTMGVDRTSLNFAAGNAGTSFAFQTPAQTVNITQTGTQNTVTWTAASDSPWLTVSPASGFGPAALSIGVQHAVTLPPAGSASVTGAITITYTGSATATSTLSARLNLPGALTAPTGLIDTPEAGATGLQGSIAVTGWAVDDVGVDRVELWRDLQLGEPTPPFASTPSDPRSGKVFVGTATLVNDARPDIEALYSTSPLNYRGGWGYLLLTWGLPNQGNGTYTLHAIAFDADGHAATLGQKTIGVANASADKPFGSIDTPAIGGTASGTVVSFGWALTPNSFGTTCKVPATGVQVSIDSGPLQPVVYGDVRTDIATLFAGFTNSAAAGGHFTFDTTALANGVHTIAWLITDDCNRAEGVGSRFFTVLNNSAAAPAAGAARVATVAAPAASLVDRVESVDPVVVARGFGELGVTVDPDSTGLRIVSLKPGERIEVRLPKGYDEAWLVVAGERRALPIGAAWDAASHLFAWQPAPAFLGDYEFVFVRGRETIRVLIAVKSRSAAPATY